MANASARHILVSDENLCKELKEKINNKETTFEAAASEFSTCPSGQSGGDLGNFTPGQMVPEFDVVVFKEAINEVHGPVKTDFGFHLIEITSRED